MRLFISATSDFKPAQGGIAELSHQMARFFARAGHAVMVAAARTADTSAWDQEQDYQIVRVDRKDRRALDGAIRQFQPDFLLVNVAGSAWDTLRWRAWRLGVPLGLFVHGTDVTKRKSLLSGWKTLTSLRLSDVILVNSHYTGREIATKKRADQPVVVFHPGLEPGYGSRNPPLPPCPVDGKIRILSLCRHTERKGIDVSLEAFARVSARFPDAVFWIAGTGSQTNALKKQAVDLGLDSRVHFWGAVDDTLREALYHAADLYMMPNRRLDDGDVEGFGISFLEANAHGVPVIGGLEGGSAEAIEPGVSGWLVDGKNVDAVADVLSLALADPNLRVELGKRGRERAVSRFGYEHLVDQLYGELTALFPRLRTGRR
jgi:phosphatidylinositol alpha-1,6-mannosyltransferase